MNDPKEYTLDMNSLVNINNLSDYEMTEAEIDEFLEKLLEVHQKGGAIELELGSADFTSSIDSIQTIKVKVKHAAVGSADTGESVN